MLKVLALEAGRRKPERLNRLAETAESETRHDSFINQRGFENQDG